MQNRRHRGGKRTRRVWHAPPAQSHGSSPHRFEWCGWRSLPLQGDDDGPARGGRPPPTDRHQERHARGRRATAGTPWPSCHRGRGDTTHAPARRRARPGACQAAGTLDPVCRHKRKKREGFWPPPPPKRPPRALITARRPRRVCYGSGLRSLAPCGGRDSHEAQAVLAPEDRPTAPPDGSHEMEG